jgi:hypothetical protein
MNTMIAAITAITIGLPPCPDQAWLDRTPPEQRGQFTCQLNDPAGVGPPIFCTFNGAMERCAWSVST